MPGVAGGAVAATCATRCGAAELTAVLLTLPLRLTELICMHRPVFPVNMPTTNQEKGEGGYEEAQSSRERLVI